MLARAYKAEVFEIEKQQFARMDQITHHIEMLNEADWIVLCYLLFEYLSDQETDYDYEHLDPEWVDYCRSIHNDPEWVDDYNGPIDY